MPKTKITEYSQTPIGNEDVGNIGITGEAPVSNIDDALQTIMAHLADMNAGASPLHDTFTLSSTVSGQGSFRFDASQVGNSTTQVLTVPNASGVILTDTTLLDGDGKITADITGNAATADDADKLDGRDGTFYQDASNLIAGEISDERLPAIISSNTTGNANNADKLDGQGGAFYLDANNLTGNIDAARLPDLISASVQAALDEKADLLGGQIDLSQLPVGFGSPAGAVMHFAMNGAPTGWLKADGSAVSRTTYAELFAAIGETFGAGDGSSTFDLPDLRGEFIRGFDDGRGVDVGRVFGAEQDDELRSHNHTIPEYSGYSNVVTGTVNHHPLSRNDDEGSGDFRTEVSGGSETRPRNIALLVCIKY